MSTFRDKFIQNVCNAMSAEMQESREHYEWSAGLIYDTANRAHYIVITDKHFNRLNRAEDKLISLENAGVDNWEGYDSAFAEDDEDEDE